MLGNHFRRCKENPQSILPAFSSCPVKLMFRPQEFGGIKSPSEIQRTGMGSVFSQQKFKGPGSLKEESEIY